jgi:hypothetical protein
VLAPYDESVAVTDKLKELGGAAESHTVTDEAMAHADVAAAEAPAETPAAPAAAA